MLSCRAEDFGKNTLKDAAGSCLVDGMSFTGTKVLLANGKAIRSAAARPEDAGHLSRTRGSQPGIGFTTIMNVTYSWAWNPPGVRATGRPAKQDAVKGLFG